MNRIEDILKTSRMVLNAWKNTIGIYLGIAIFLNAYIVFSIRPFISMGNTTHSGITLPNIIFIFIVGITGFYEEFSVAGSMNINRRVYFIAHTSSLFIVVIFLSIVDMFSGHLFELFSGVSFYHMAELIFQIRSDNLIILPFIAAIYLFAATSGWLIRMLYYRANKLQKMLLSLSPVILLFLLRLLDFGFISEQLRHTDIIPGFFVYLLNDLNILMSSILFFSIVLVNLFLCYLLIRRAPVA